MKREIVTMTRPFATRQDFNVKKMGSRMLRAARLDGETFRELRDDPSASAQSVLVVAIIGLCYGAGLGFFGFFIVRISPLEIFAITLIGLIAAVLAAFVWSGTTFLIVTKIFRGKITYLGLARPFFFSWTPGLLFILMSSPVPPISEVVRVDGLRLDRNRQRVRGQARCRIQHSTEHVDLHHMRPTPSSYRVNTPVQLGKQSHAFFSSALQASRERLG